jgi:uncharacterized protein YndB with AHSA1/START domain
MTLTTIPAAARTVRVEKLLPGPIDRVWSYLIDSEKRGRWLASGSMDLSPGGAVRFVFDHTRISDEPTPDRFKGGAASQVMDATVVRCEPPRLLAHTWPQRAGEPPSEVMFELSQEGDKVRLVVTHARIAGRTDMVLNSGGWLAHLAMLEDELEGRPHRGFWTAFFEAEAQAERTIGQE